MPGICGRQLWESAKKPWKVCLLFPGLSKIFSFVKASLWSSIGKMGKFFFLWSRKPRINFLPDPGGVCDGQPKRGTWKWWLVVRRGGSRAFAQNATSPEFGNLCLSPRAVSGPIESSPAFSLVWGAELARSGKVVELRDGLCDVRFVPFHRLKKWLTIRCYTRAAGLKPLDFCSKYWALSSNENHFLLKTKTLKQMMAIFFFLMTLLIEELSECLALQVQIFFFFKLLYRIIGCLCGEHTSVLAFAELWK